MAKWTLSAVRASCDAGGEAATHITRETDIWKKVIADAGIRLE
jgi:hypothetical protein